MKSALKKTLYKSKLINIAELFSEGQKEKFSVVLIDTLFDIFKSDHPDFNNKNFNQPSEYIVDINVSYINKLKL